MKLNFPVIALLWCISGTGLWAQPVQIDSQWQQGNLMFGRLSEQASGVVFAGRELWVSPDGRFVFGLGRDAKPTAELTVKLKNGGEKVLQYAVRQRQYQIQRIEGVPPRTVNPPPEEMARIRKESELTRKARAVDSVRDDFLKPFQWPLLGPITGVYGSQRVYNGEPRRPHFGVDVAQPTGTPVVAPNSGVVTLAYDNMFFSGGTLIIDHGRGVSSTFIHLSKIHVAQGQEVKSGELIAEVGATGRVTGPHLDWRINWFSQPIDPQLVVGPMPAYD